MNRRLVVAATGAALLAASAVPTYAAGKPAACAAFADAKGDSGPVPDPALDITGVRFSTVGKTLVAAITLDKLAERPIVGAGNRVQVNFTLAGRAVTLYYKFGPAREQEANAFYQQGIRVDEVFYSDVLEGKVAGNTVTLTVSVGELSGAVEKKVNGQKISGISAEALASFVATNQGWDSAEAPASLTHTLGAACK